MQKNVLGFLYLRRINSERGEGLWNQSLLKLLLQLLVYISF